MLHPFCKSFSAKILDWRRYFIHEIAIILHALLVKKSIPDWHLYITQMETKWTKRYTMTSHVIAYRSTELLFGTHTFNFNCFFDDFNCVFTQIRCLSRLLYKARMQITVSVIFLDENTAFNDFIITGFVNRIREKIN